MGQLLISTLRLKRSFLPFLFSGHYDGKRQSFLSTLHMKNKYQLIVTVAQQVAIDLDPLTCSFGYRYILCVFCADKKKDTTEKAYARSQKKHMGDLKAYHCWKGIILRHAESMQNVLQEH
jgi:hypothetical protein